MAKFSSQINVISFPGPFRIIPAPHVVSRMCNYSVFSKNKSFSWFLVRYMRNPAINCMCKRTYLYTRDTSLFKISIKTAAEIYLCSRLYDYQFRESLEGVALRFLFGSASSPTAPQTFSTIYRRLYWTQCFVLFALSGKALLKIGSKVDFPNLHQIKNSPFILSEMFFLENFSQ